MSFYYFLVLVHVISAIIGVGPGFILTFVVKKANTMTELRHAYYIRHRLHRFVMIGGILLLVTGLWMGFLHPYLFEKGWYIVSIFLFLIVLGAGPVLLAPRSKPIKKLLAEANTEEIPPEYDELSKGLFFYERLTNILLFIVIVLMVLKPF
ncbi:DUF2269 family protein [Virgibacillus sp. W0181]|uniref:DUF2269 family protein n=1 Tax=Virgibacillus sp. W0181 TaxID=3391581 RepID=UPI003F4564B3